MKYNNITVTIQKGVIWSEGLISEETSCTNVSNILLNMDNGILYTEGNAFVINDMHAIECTFENDYIHVSNDLSMQ